MATPRDRRDKGSLGEGGKPGPEPALLPRPPTASAKPAPDSRSLRCLGLTQRLVPQGWGGWGGWGFGPSYWLAQDTAQLQIKADRVLVWFPVNQAGPDHSVQPPPGISAQSPW